MSDSPVPPPTSEGPAFLGSEFLLWLWFQTETHGGEFRLEEPGPVGLAFDQMMELKASDRGTKVMVRGDLPTRLPEASAALRADKLPTLARLVLAWDDETVELTLDSNTFDLRSVKVVGSESIDAAAPEDRDAERANLLFTSGQVLDGLYRLYLQHRLDETFAHEVLRPMREWVKDRQMRPRTMEAVN